MCYSRPNRDKSLRGESFYGSLIARLSPLSPMEEGSVGLRVGVGVGRVVWGYLSGRQSALSSGTDDYSFKQRLQNPFFYHTRCISPLSFQASRSK